MTHRHGQTVDDIANAPSGERTLKVSSTTLPNKLAGSIVLVCQGGEAPMLLTMGATCVNQAGLPLPQLLVGSMVEEGSEGRVWGSGSRVRSVTANATVHSGVCAPTTHSLHHHIVRLTSVSSPSEKEILPVTPTAVSTLVRVQAPCTIHTSRSACIHTSYDIDDMLLPSW